MRRTLIKQEAFNGILKESVTTAQRELVEAQHVVAKTLGKGPVELLSFTESKVVYKTPEKTYIHAGYEIKNNQLTFNNIEELVVDEASRKEQNRAQISEMINSLLEDKVEKAKGHFAEYMSMVQWNEGKKDFPFKKGGKKKLDKEEVVDKCKDKDMKEAYIVAANVLDYVDHVKTGASLSESIVKRDEKGNVTDIKIPTNEARNASKLKTFGWTTLNHENYQVRNKAVPALKSEQAFGKAIANLKRQSAFADVQELEEALDAVVKNYPQLIMVTESELAKVLAETLKNVGVTNFDDQTCAFMAEGILMRSHAAYSEKVAQILTAAGAPLQTEGDAYEHFKVVAEEFYPSLDEKFGLERKAFADLYDVLEGIYKKAEAANNSLVKKEAATHLNGLADVLNGNVQTDIILAEEAAQFIAKLVESNLEGGSWVVSNKPHMTVSGDHPDMAKKASQGYSPAKDFSGNWGDPAPMIGADSMAYTAKNANAARKNSWGNIGGSDAFPSLKNPYVPKAGDFTMKGEKGVDKENKDGALWTSGDTWPSLKNPYVPKAETPKSYKMKNGKDTDLVVDR